MPEQAPVSEKKIAELNQRLAELDIHEKDLEETFVHGQGKGGQKINKTASAVQLLHQPTGIRVKCQKTRERSLNRFYARRMLADAIEKFKTGTIAKKESAAEKIRKQKQRRKRRSASKQNENPGND